MKTGLKVLAAVVLLPVIAWLIWVALGKFGATTKIEKLTNNS